MSGMIPTSAARPDEASWANGHGIEGGLRGHVEDALRESEARFEAFMNHSPAVAYIKDAQGRIMYVNERLEKVFNVKFSELRGRTDFEWLPEVTARRLWDNDRHVLQTGEGIEVIEEVITPDGSSQKWLSFKFRMSDRDHRPLVGAVSVDVTERIRARETLAQTERKYRGLFENAIEGIFQRSRDGRYLSANPALARIYGYPSPEALQRDLAENGREVYVRAERRQEFERIMDEQGSISDFESEVYRKDGSTIWISESAVAMRDANGRRNSCDGFVVDITARRRAEQELQAAHEQLEARVAERTAELAKANANVYAAALENSRLAAAIESAAIGVVISDPTLPDHPLIFCNPAFTTITGYEKDEALGRNCRFLQGPETDPVIVAQMREAIGKRQPFRGTIRNYRKDGTAFWNEVTINPVFDQDGTLINFVALQADITTRVQAEEAMRTTEERYARSKARNLAIFETALDCMITIDHLGGIVEFNPAAEKTFGYSREEAVGRPLRDLVRLQAAEEPELAHPGTLPVFALLDRRVEVPAVCRDGRQLLVEFAMTRVPADGPALFTAYLRDRTESKRSEERLRLLESAVVNAHDGVLITDAHWANGSVPRILFVNEAFTHNTGYIAAEVLGQNPRFLCGPKTDRAELGRVCAALRRAQPVQTEMLNYRKDGSQLWVELSIVPVRNQKGACTHWVAVQRDVTRRRMTATALEEAKERAERASRAKNEFLSRMSHELRTPLNAILGFAQLLDRKDLGVVPRERVGHILRAGRLLLDLINEVLDIARIEAGRLEMSLEAVSVSETFEEVISLLRPLAAQRHVELLYEAAKDSDRHVRADRQRLKQVLLNMVANAVKYHHVQGGHVTVACATGASDRLRLTVSDNGPGIPLTKLDRLFVPFDRLDAEHTNVQGTGLGLALSKRLVEAMAGAIGVESEEGKGATFWVELPSVAHSLGRIALPRRDFAGASEADPITQRSTVLYIEDNLVNVALVEHLLAEHPGIELITAMQGRVGLDLAQEHRPNLILLDLQLPDLSGHEVLTQLKARVSTRDIPVVVLSADATAPQIARLKKAGASHYLTKPMDVGRFLEVLQSHLPKPTSDDSPYALG